MRKYIIDRFEKGYAVLEEENGHLIDMAAAQLPREAKEGDVILMKSGGSFEIDREETNRRHRIIQDFQKRLMD
ncbi:MAG TPA: DUF3006 domain-containing protein [Clostridia bacterium]|nr:DUF3006 domain-containing protein [Clostridia bacterium]